MGVTEERKEAKFCEGGERDGRHIDTDRFRGGKNGTGKGGCVGPYFVVYLYSVSSYSPSHSSLPQSVHPVPLLLNTRFK